MRYSALSLLPALAAASPMLQVGTIHKDAAPILSSTQSKEVPNSYMVVFKKHVKESHAKEHHDWVQSIHTKKESERMELRKRSQFPVTTEIFDGLKHTYNIIGGMVGYSGHFDDETIEAIRRHPDVSYSLYLLRSLRGRGRCLLERWVREALSNSCCLLCHEHEHHSACAFSIPDQPGRTMWSSKLVLRTAYRAELLGLHVSTPAQHRVAGLISAGSAGRAISRNHT